MGLVGSLEDLGLGDILQIVSLSRKSGILNLGWGEVKGKIFFNDGQVVAAVSNAHQISIGQVLVKEGIISTAAQAAIDVRVNATATAKQIKQVLAAEFKVPPDVLEEKIREQIETVAFGFFTWPEGTFSFELQEIQPELAALAPPNHAFILEIGLSPQFLAMEGARLQDEYRRSHADAPVGPPLKAYDPEAQATPAPNPGIEEIDFEPPRHPEDETSFATLGDSTPPPGSALAAPPDEVATPPALQPAAEFGSVADALKFYESHPGQAESAPPPLEKAIESSQAATAGARATPPAPPPAAVQEPRPTPPAPASIPQIIILDDDPFLLESLGHHLANKGYPFQTFTEIGKALQRVQEMVDLGDRPRLVISDLILPNLKGDSTLGGIEALEHIKAINPAIAVLLMSDYENLPARAKAEKLGAGFFFMKPKESQLDEDYESPELVNFVSVLDDAIRAELKKPREKEPERGTGMVNLGEELRREFGDDVSPGPAAEKVAASPGLHMLKAMIGELNDPTSSGQITLLILRFAAELMNRSVIFLVARNQLAGLGQFGIVLDGADPQRHVRKIRIPLNEPSIFREAIQKRLPLKKPLKDNKWNQYLVSNLGGIKPKEVFVAPIIAGGKIAALLYGDNVPDVREIGDTESLEIFLAQAGLAMEKALLERRLKEMDRPLERA